MHFPWLLVGAATLVTADILDPPPIFDRYAPLKPGISWEPCATNEKKQCGRFEVPMDYNNTLAGKASLAVARIPATNLTWPKLGTLFLNPGGPGGSGVKTILGSNADNIMRIVEGRYDLVSWDPRGVGRTIPRVDCFNNGTEERQFWQGTIPRAGLEARGDFTEPGDLEAFYDQVDAVDSLLEKLGDKCLQHSPNILQYVGTTAAVRDMMSLNDYLMGPNSLVNFWGFSYGTAIGIYLVNMFPENVGRIVLDGVVDPVYWANRPPHQIWAINAESTDKALTGFVTACALAGPGYCAFSSEGSTSAQLDKKIRELLDLAYEYKKKNGPKALFGSSYIRKKIFQGMYTPEQWPQLAIKLKTCWEALNGTRGWTLQQCINTKPFKPQTVPPKLDPSPDYSLQAITCGDALGAGGVTTRTVFEELVNVTRNVSHMFGPMWGIGGFYCHKWRARAVERFTGPWTRPTIRNKVLVIGNEADPVTPYRSAKSVADALGTKAMLIEQKGFGHTSFAMHSECTLNLVRSYFKGESLEWSTRECQIDKQIFPNMTMDMLTSLLGNNTITNSSKSRHRITKAQTSAHRLTVVALALMSSIGLFFILSIKPWVSRSMGGKYDRHTTNSVFVMVADEEKEPIFSMSYIERKAT